MKDKREFLNNQIEFVETLLNNVDIDFPKISVGKDSVMRIYLPIEIGKKIYNATPDYNIWCDDDVWRTKYLTKRYKGEDVIFDVKESPDTFVTFKDCIMVICLQIKRNDLIEIAGVYNIIEDERTFNPDSDDL